MCGPAPEIDNAYVDSYYASLGATVNYKCYYGYRQAVPDVSMSTRCSWNEDYFWNGTLTTCESN